MLMVLIHHPFDVNLPPQILAFSVELERAREQIEQFLQDFIVLSPGTHFAATPNLRLRVESFHKYEYLWAQH